MPDDFVAGRHVGKFVGLTPPPAMKVVSSKIARAISAGKAHHGYDGCYVKPVGYMSVMIRKRSGSISNWWRAIRKRKRSRLWRSCDAWPYACGIACAKQKSE